MILDPWLIVVLGGRKILGSREDVRQSLWVVDQNGEVLRTNPVTRFLEAECNERDLGGSLLAHEAGGGCGLGHVFLISDRVSVPRA
jgi:serine protease inhibitor ecotin